MNIRMNPDQLRRDLSEAEKNIRKLTYQLAGECLRANMPRAFKPKKKARKR